MGRAGRYYGGCGYYDDIERYCRKLWKKVFNTDYHVNVQPHSGSQANMAAYMSVLNPGDTILSMSLSAGGHLTHSSPVSFVSKLYKVIPYGVNSKGLIDYDEVEHLAKMYKPKLIVAGASAYSRIIDFQRFYEIAQKVKAYFMVDMAHIAGLIAAGAHPSPFGLADIITTTTHKTLRGPRGGMIFCKPELANKIDSAVFPGCQGGPLQNVIAAKAICAAEALDPSYSTYIHNVVKNSKAMADEFISLGYNIVSGGTDNHLFLLDLTNFNISGAEVQAICEKHGITLNKNSIPEDPRSYKECSGVRIGTAAETTRGLTSGEARLIAGQINYYIKEYLKEKGEA